MDKRFERNIPSISLQDQESLAKKHVLVVGCGGLGGYVIENLVRCGVGRITAADPDSFEISNLNRQLLSSTELIGTRKALAAKRRAESINPNISFAIWTMKITRDNVSHALAGKDLVLDALDSVEDRLMLEEACAAAGLPLIHGAVSGWSAQVMTVLPGSHSLSDFYAHNKTAAGQSVLSFTTALCAALQSAEALKLLCGLPSELTGKMLLADLKDGSFRICDRGEAIFRERSLTITVRTWGQSSNEIAVPEHTTLSQLMEKLQIQIDHASVNGKDIGFAEFPYTTLSDRDLVTFRDFHSASRGG